MRVSFLVLMFLPQRKILNQWNKWMNMLKNRIANANGMLSELQLNMNRCGYVDAIITDVLQCMYIPY